jgi:hypothetical protein
VVVKNISHANWEKSLNVILPFTYRIRSHLRFQSNVYEVYQYLFPLRGREDSNYKEQSQQDKSRAPRFSLLRDYRAQYLRRLSYKERLPLYATLLEVPKDAV